MGGGSEKTAHTSRENLSVKVKKEVQQQKVWGMEWGGRWLVLEKGVAWGTRKPVTSATPKKELRE